MQSAQDEGWTIAYQKVTGKRANWSGEKDGRIFYARAILLCHDDEAGYFRPRISRDGARRLRPGDQAIAEGLQADRLPIACDG